MSEVHFTYLARTEYGAAFTVRSSWEESWLLRFREKIDLLLEMEASFDEAKKELKPLVAELHSKSQGGLEQ